MENILELKEYSVILTRFFMYESEDINNKKAYFQNFSWFQFYVFMLCMIMYVSLLP